MKDTDNYQKEINDFSGRKEDFDDLSNSFSETVGLVIVIKENNFRGFVNGKCKMSIGQVV